MEQGTRGTLTDVTTRFAVHDTFDRLVLTLPPGVDATSRQSPDGLALQLPGCGQVMQPARLGRRMLGLQSTPGQASLKLAPGAHARVWRLGDRLVVDILIATLPQQPVIRPGAPGGITAPAAAGPPPNVHGPAQQARLAPLATIPDVRATRSSARLLAPPIQAGIFPAMPANQDPGKVSASADRPSAAGTVDANGSHAQEGATPAQPARQQSARLADVTDADSALAPAGDSAVLPLSREGGIDGPGVLVPFPRGTGAAAFERGGQAHIVFDQSKLLDLSALKDDAVFGDIREQVLPDGLELRFRIPAASQVRLLRRTAGWVVVVANSGHPAAVPGFIARAREGTLSFDADAPGHIVVLADETTGARLLVATQSGAGGRVAAAHFAPEFAILPSWFGLVLAPVSDRLVFRKSAAGFELFAQAPPNLALAWSPAGTVSWPDGRVMTRTFDLPDLPFDGLHRRLGQASRDAANAPRPARFRPRLAVARAMLAQGMDLEASAVLHTAVADDPAHLDDPEVAGLSAIASWLSSKRGGADAPAVPFDARRLGASDEAALWRALLQPRTPDPVTQGAALAPVWPLILNYPQAMRQPMLLASAALLQAAGQTDAWSALLSANPDPALDLSRAALLQRQGKFDAALALLDRVASRPDRLARADAMQQAVELRLLTHKLNETAAADALDRQLYAWRGYGRELHLKMRVAELRARAGAWRAALSTLREAEQAFPEARAELHDAEEKTVADLLGGERASRLGSFDLVTLAEEAANLFSSAEVERRLGPTLVEKLLALDLPGRAEPILRKLFDRAPDSISRAQYGLGLASLVAERGDTEAALAVLDAPDGDNLPPGLADRRTLLRARLLAASGKADQALALLADQHNPETNDFQAELLERRGDWRGASAVLNATLQQPGFVRLAEPGQRALILRLARDESTAGDIAGLHVLRDAQKGHFASGDGAELFAVLTADPIKSEADLPRSARELASLRALPAKLAQPGAF